MTSKEVPSKVSQVFAAAAKAFNHLGDLTMQLHTQYEAIPGSKWTDAEVDLLRKAVQQFGNDLEKVTAAVKTRTMSQVKHAIKRKVYNEAGISLGKQKSQSAKKRPLPATPNDSTDKVNHAAPPAVPAKTPRFSDEPVETSYAEEVVPESEEVPEAAIITEHVPTNSLVDVENIDESSSSMKKLDQFISTHPIHGRAPGGVSEAAVSNPPPLPPLDLVSEQT